VSGPTVQLRGVVRTGKGDFAHWIDRLSDHYRRKTGVQLFPGTLNVHLLAGHTYLFPPDRIIRLERAEYGGQVSVSILPCTLFDRPAFVLRTDGDDGKHGDPPEAILEIASDLPLRETYGLSDGDIVEITLPR
jgi:CTP-dependent riboflavin kinase